MRDIVSMSISSALKKVVVEALSGPEEANRQASEFEEKLAEVEREMGGVRDRLRTEERIAREYFDIIERIEKERDEWKEMFFRQSLEHQNAQGLLQKYLADCSTHLSAAIRQLNFFRKAAALEPVMTPAILEQLPKDIPENYGKLIAELAASASPQTDGKAKRSKVLGHAEQKKS